MEIDALEGFGMMRVVISLLNIMKNSIYEQDKKIWI
jgi:hypothetical protein